MMAGLFFLVEDTTQPMAEPMPEPEKPEKPVREKYVFKYEFSKEWGVEQVTSFVKDQSSEDWDGPMHIVAFDVPEEDPKVKNWKKWERIAKAIQSKPLFSRYEENEKPQVIRLSCSGEENRTFCNQLIGQQSKAAIFFIDGVPRPFPAQARSDKTLMEHIYEWMQPAVRYIEEIDDIVEFTEATEHPIKVFLFGEDQEGAFEEAVKEIRDWGKYGRNVSPRISEHFDVESPPTLTMFRDFEPERINFEGDLTKPEEIRNWVTSNQLPLFGEYTQRTMARYHNKNKGMESQFVWLMVDPTEDSTEAVLAAGKTAAEENKEFTVTYVDVLAESDMARAMGAETFPVCVMLNPKNPTAKMLNPIDGENPGESITACINAYVEAQNASEVEEDEYYYDDEYEDMDYYEDEYQAEGEGGEAAAAST